MNDVSKLYEVYLNNELTNAKNDVLNIVRLDQKILAFVHDLSIIAEDSRCYLFWEKEDSINHEQLLEDYIEGLTMLMSIGYELRIDNIKNYNELPSKISIIDLFFKIYNEILSVKNDYDSRIYQDTIDDFFTLGFLLGIKVEEIVDAY